MSDGTFSPDEIVMRAAQAGLTYLALTDHDTMAGTREAIEAGRRYHVNVLSGVEFNNEWPHELHIIGLDVETGNAALCDTLEQLRSWREARNAKILQKLLNAGYDIEEYLTRSEGNTTRLHFAIALCKAGYATSVHDAFRRYLWEGKPGYCEDRLFTPKETIALIRGAYGLPVLAHPSHIRRNVFSLVTELKEMGLMGIEAYYPTSTPGQTELFESIAKQHNLLVTCGSDYHGANRPDISIGCAWRDVPSLQKTAVYLKKRFA
jgi:predicted metal-dependent phosphoesterase TrpH